MSQQDILDLVQEAQNWSNEAWVDFEEDFHGIVIQNMSLYHLMMLDGVGSPFLKKKKIACGLEYGNLHVELRIYLR